MTDCPRCDELREQIRRLESVLRSAARTPARWRLTLIQERLFCALVRAGTLSKEQCWNAMYFDRRDSDLQPELKIVDVVICKLRQKLTPFGVEIETLWGRGYGLDQATREWFRGHGGGDAVRGARDRDQTEQRKHRIGVVHAPKTAQGIG